LQGGFQTSPVACFRLSADFPLRVFEISELFDFRFDFPTRIFQRVQTHAVRERLSAHD